MAFSAAEFYGLDFDTFPSLNWDQVVWIRLILALFAIWLPIFYGLVWTHSLLGRQRFGWSLLVSLLTPLFSLVFIIVLMGILVLTEFVETLNRLWLQGA